MMTIFWQRARRYGRSATYMPIDPREHAYGIGQDQYGRRRLSMGVVKGDDSAITWDWQAMQTAKP